MRVLVIVGMFMSVVVFVKMIVLMRMVVLVSMIVLMRVGVDQAGAVGMLVLMPVGMLVGVGAAVSREHVFTGANSFTRVNIDLGAGEAAAHDLAGFESRAYVE